MSASDKKKLRRELNAAAMTEKQQTEQKKQKKAQTATTTFIIAMILVVVLVISSVLVSPITNAIAKNTVAAKVGDHEISAIELNYYYHDAITNLYNQFSSYGDYADLYLQLYTGLNPAKPLDEQTFDKETKETWADYFVKNAITNAKWVYVLCDAAAKDNHTLTEDEQKAIDSTVSYLSLYAAFYGYGSADAYVRSIYGNTASIDGYKEYYAKCQLASSYANKYLTGLKYTNEQYREYEADKMANFSSYSWASIYIKTSDYLTFLKLGTVTKGDDGKDKTTYSDEDNQKALEAAKADADKLFNGEFKNVEEMNAAIKALEINASKTTPPTASDYVNKLYTYAESYTPTEDALKWLTSEERVEGDKLVVPNVSKDSNNKETTNGYYVLFFTGSRTNAEENIGTVRHLLVQFEKDKDGKVTDAAKEAAKKEAESLLAKYNEGKKTELDFTTLIAAHSDDSKDGLYSDINPDSGYVESFKAWAIADHKPGDVEIIESEYGYHIMYYVSCNELNYRDYLIDTEMRNGDYEKWEEALLKDVKTETLDLRFIDADLVLSGS